MSAVFSAIWRRKWARWSLRTLLVLLALGIAFDYAAGVFYLRLLTTAVRQTSGDELTARTARYLPPFGLKLTGVHLIRTNADGRREDFLDAATLILALDHIPRSGQPIVITRLEIGHPTLIVDTPAPVADEAAGALATAAPRPASATSPSPPPTQPVQPAPPEPTSASAASPTATQPADTQPSAVSDAVTISPSALAPEPALPNWVDKVHLRRVSVRDGSIVWRRPNRPDVAVRQLNLSMAPAAGSSEIYQYRIQADPGVSGRLGTSGAVDFKDHRLVISNLGITAKMSAAIDSLEPESRLRKQMASAAADGVVEFHAQASVPLSNWRSGSFKIDVQLRDAHLTRGRLHVENGSADFSIDANDGKLAATLAKLHAGSGPDTLDVHRATIAITPDFRQWKLADVDGDLVSNGGVWFLDRAKLRGRFRFTAAAGGLFVAPAGQSPLAAFHPEIIAYPRAVSLQPPGYAIPIERVDGGRIALRGGVIRIENLTAMYGGDRLVLDGAHITLDDDRQAIVPGDVKRQVRVEGISGTLICRQPTPPYPGGLGKVMAQLRPSGNFAIGGGSWFAINPWLAGEDKKPRPDYFFRVSTSGGSFALTHHKAPLTNILGDATVSPLGVEITSIRGQALGGTVVASGQVDTLPPFHYKAVATFYNIDLSQLSQTFEVPAMRPLKGVTYVKADFSGNIAWTPLPPADTFTASGECQIADGNFGGLHSLGAAANSVSRPAEALDGSAAGLFVVEKRSVQLRDCIIGNPMFGVEGEGTVGFDKSLELHVVAAPLGDWAANLKHAGIPVVDGVGSALAGAIQQTVNGAQRTLLWDIRICGTATNPKVETTPAPLITQPVAALFAQLMQGGTTPKLIAQVRSTNPK